MGKIQPHTTHCKRGHPRTEENTNWVPGPPGYEHRLYAECRLCKNALGRKQAKAYYRRQAEQRRVRDERERLHRAPKRRCWHRDPETGCWLWDGRTKKGYGQVSLGGGGDGRQWISAPRYFYVSFKTEEFDPMKQIHHLCHNPRCVNPDHLVAVTPEEHERLTNLEVYGKRA